VGELAPNGAARVEIPVRVGPEAGGALSNQASVVYKQSTEAVQSNAYIAQVAEPLAVSQPAPTEEAQPTATQAAQGPTQEAQPSATTPQQPESTQATTPVEGASGTGSASGQAPVPTPVKPAPRPTQAKSPAAIPQTGGSFPLVLAVLFLVMALLARYLRGSRTRKL
jgi:cobalamin biosynthesis Mg chelatase CobN